MHSGSKIDFRGQNLDVKADPYGIIQKALILIVQVCRIRIYQYFIFYEGIHEVVQVESRKKL